MDTINLVVRNLPQYAIAVALATEWHKGQKYGDSDKDYMYHLLNVARIVKERNHHLSDPELDNLMAVAMLHDILEDTKCLPLDLHNADIDIDNIMAVMAITKCDEETKISYLRRCAKNPLALEVKICDTATNLEHSIKAGSFKRIHKYSKQMSYLNERQRYIAHMEAK